MMNLPGRFLNLPGFFCRLKPKLPGYFSRLIHFEVAPLRLRAATLARAW